MKKEHRDIFNALSEAQLMGLCIDREARGEPDEGKIAVGSTVLNRVDFGKTHKGWGRLYGNTVRGCIMAPAQFSWLNECDPQYKESVGIARDFEGAFAAHPHLFVCYGIALGLLQRNIQRNVTSIFYHAKSVHPSWAGKMAVEREIGNHIFYLPA